MAAPADDPRQEVAVANRNQTDGSRSADPEEPHIATGGEDESSADHDGGDDHLKEDQQPMTK